MKNIWFRLINDFAKKRLGVIEKHHVKTNILFAIPFWIASTLTGLVAVLYTKLFAYAEELTQRILHIHLWYIFILSPVCFLLSWYIVKKNSPQAGGSGIPQVMAAIDLATPRNENKIPALLSLKVVVVKIVSSLFMILGGGAIGREGPTIQIAGSIFRFVYRWVPSAWPKVSQRNYILTGAAAGLAAAFNTPLGGIVFAIEELARVHISAFRTALFTAVIIAGLVAQGVLGPYLYLGYPDVKQAGAVVFIGVIGVAIMAGLAGAGMCRIIFAILKWKRHFTQIKAVAFIVLSGLLIALIAYFIDFNILGSGKHIMLESLFQQNKDMKFTAVISRIFGPIMSFSIGGAGGIFAPSLAAGASIGALLSDILGFVDANANIVILCGMVGFLTGVTRTPFTSAILVLEMTDRHGIILHLMLAALVSNIAALIVEKHSLYERLKKTYIEDTVVS